VALSTNAKRILISLGIGTVFTLGYFVTIAIYVFIFYRDDPVYAYKHFVPLWPMEVPQRLYVLFGGDLHNNVRLTNWVVTLANIPLYGSLVYAIMRLIVRFQNEKPPNTDINEPPPPPRFDDPSG